MIVIVGCIVVIGAVLGGFSMAGGHVGALIHPSEIVTIGGAALGALIVSSNKRILVDLAKGILSALKGSAYGKATYLEMFRCMYELLRVARRDGLLALETHISNPHESSILLNYRRIVDNEEVMNFISGALMPLIDGTAKPEHIEALLEAELKMIEEEHHQPLNVLLKTADALPGFGIVAAVLGIVITMGHIDGPVEEIGHKVGAALVGTFLGILLSYGFFAPLACKIELLGWEKLTFFRTVGAIIVAFANNSPPKVAIDQARRSVGSECRPSRSDLDEMFKAVEAS
jgi:chemotaxis protein MotA